MRFFRTGLVIDQLITQLLLFQFRLLINHVILLLLGSILLNVALLQVIIHNLQLWFVLIFRQFPLLFHDQSVPILEGILCPAFEMFWDFRPLFQSVVSLNELEESDILVELPWSLLELGGQIACPVLTTLLGITIDFILIEVELVQFLRDFLPVMNLTIVPESLIIPFPDNLTQESTFIVTPTVMRKGDFFQAEPLKHTYLTSDSRNKCSYEFPILLLLKIKIIITNCFSILL